MFVVFFFVLCEVLLFIALVIVIDALCLTKSQGMSSPPPARDGVLDPFTRNKVTMFVY